MLRCIVDTIGMARWPMFNNTIVSALNYSDQLKQLEEKFTVLESTIDKMFDNIKWSEKPEGILPGR